jgi:hypothetical protein
LALYDSADLLAKTKALLKRPSTDEDLTDAQLYLWLGDAQTYWLGQIAVHCPELNWVSPELLTSSDSGATYTLASYPLGGVEIRSSRSGDLLIPGPDWGDTTDYVIEGQTVRIPHGRTRTFSAGPYARYVATPAALDGSTAPVMKPAYARLLLPARAAITYCLAGGYRDPAPYMAIEQRLWSGDPNMPGDTGILGQLKTQYFASGMAAVKQPYDGAWWRSSPDLS